MPKIVQYNLPPGGTVTQVADNQVALEIESTDAKDYIIVDTTDGSEVLTLKAGGSTATDGENTPKQLQIDSAGTVTIGSTEGDISIGGASAKLSFARAGGVAINCSHGSGELYFQMAGSNKVKFAANGNVGIATTAPGQILDVNSGSGNIIADGYDTHSLSRYKENVSVAGTGYLEKVTACPPKQWTRVPFVSADEIKAATIEEFGQSAWDLQFPEEDSHRNKALYNMPAGEMKTWVDDWADARREERRQDEKWQKVRLGLVADADDTASSFPEATAENDAGEVSGINTMSYVGILHAAIVELAAKVEELHAGLEPEPEA